MSATDIWISLITFVLIYIALGAADLVLMLRYGRRGLAQAEAEASIRSAARAAAPALPQSLALTY